jgi:hypothetical protein
VCSSSTGLHTGTISLKDADRVCEVKKQHAAAFGGGGGGEENTPKARRGVELEHLEPSVGTLWCGV